MTPRTLLDLGRVSNLPTVWTNVFAGAVLSGGRLEAVPLFVLCIAASLFYVGGMFLNDAFDREFDARLRSDRPIPSGRATASLVFKVGFLMLAVALALLGIAGQLVSENAVSTPVPWKPLVAGVVLASLIVLYDAFHKGNPLSAVVMGLCRTGLYVTAAMTLGTFTVKAGLGALLLLCYVVGLTAVARKEAAVPRLVGLVGPLIAGISLLDAVLIALNGPLVLAAIAALGFPLTLAGQRYVKGT